MSLEAWGDEGDCDPLEAARDKGWIDPVDVSKAMRDVWNERDRQVNEEGATDATDDAYVRGELVVAAMCYGTNAVTVARLIADGVPREQIDRLSERAGMPGMWPWSRDWWKPKGARRNLVRAAALMIAEIERLDRVAAKVADASDAA